jgi:hypothetical protein
MDAMDFGFDEEDDLSSALGTETLAARDMVPEGFDNTPRAHVPTRYYPIRKVVYYQAIHRPAGLLGSLHLRLMELQNSLYSTCDCHTI